MSRAYERVGKQVSDIDFFKSFALRVRRLRRAGGSGAEKNQRDRDSINDQRRKPDGSGPLLLNDKAEGRESERRDDGR